MTYSGVNGKSIALLGWWVPALAIAVGSGIGENRAIAQLISDDTLGSESSIVTPLDALRDRIDGGAVRGSNLFHSFQEFNIDTGRGAFFDNPAAIENILTRVTGGNASEIFGTLGVLGDANLFLVNPSGIVFGPDAQLDVGGSFFASTAGGILFPDGYEFSATNPESGAGTGAPPLLMVNVPIGLQFGANPGGILNQSVATNDVGEDSVVGLQVPLGETLGLVGGEIALQGGNVTAQSGRVELGSVGGNSTVSLTPIASGFALGYEGVENFQNINLSQQARVDTRGESGGDVQVRANRLRLQDGSAILAETQGAGRGGTLSVNATESVELSGTFPDVSLVTGLSVGSDGSGDAGEVDINTGQLTILDGANISIETRGEGQGGVLSVNATESVELSGTVTNPENGTAISALSARTLGSGDGGDININTGQLRVLDGAGIFLESLNPEAGGRAGRFNVNATDSVELSGIATTPDRIFRSGVFASTLGMGDGGEVHIDTGQLTIRDRATIFLESLLDEGVGGRGGILSVDAGESVEIIGSDVSVSTVGIGDAGEVNINTGQLLLQDGARIFLDSLSQGTGGRAGTLTVNAAESVELSGTNSDGTSGSRVSANTFGMGNAGEINIDTEQLSVRDGGVIFISTVNAAQGGILNVNATESVELIGTTPDGSFRSGLVGFTSGAGNGGIINVTTGQLTIQDGAYISLASLNEEEGGSSGALTVNATESVELIGTTPDGSLGSGVFAIISGIGDGRTLDINTGRLIVRDGATITLTSDGEGGGGNLTVNASESVEVLGTATVPTVLEDESGTISARLNSTLTSLTSGTGDGGAIDINTERLIVRDGANISVFTSSEGGGGTLRVNASESVELIGVEAQPREITTFQPGGEPIVSTQTLSSNLAAVTDGLGDGGDIVINTGRLRLQDGAEISLNSLNEGAGGRGGRLTVNATESVELTGSTPDGTAGSDIFANTSGLGDAGDITINTGRLLLQDGAQIFLLSTNMEAGGRTGTLTVNATESVELIGTTAVPQTQETQLNETEFLRSTATFPSGLNIATFGEGDAGEIVINTRRLSVRDGADIFANTNGSGRGGTLTVNATESVEVVGAAAIPDEMTTVRETESGQSVFTTTQTSFSSLLVGTLGSGNGGQVDIFTRRLSVRDGASVSLQAQGEGQGGTLTVNATELVELSGNFEDDASFLSVSTFRGGNSGEITISTEQLKLRDGGAIVASSFGSGSGGTVTVNATESVELMGLTPNGLPGGLFASTRSRGDGGNITVETSQLRVADEAEISVSSRLLTLEELASLDLEGAEIAEPLGNPGSIDITADDVRLENGGFLDAISSTGQGGNIDVRARDIRLRQGLITASGRGNDPTLEGNIAIDAETLVLLDNSQIITSSTDPQGGSNIRLSPIDGENGSLVLLQSPDSLINAQGELIVEGELDPDPAEIPDLDTIDAASLLGQDFCSQRRGSEFIYTGRGGIPPEPSDPASPTTVWQDWSLTEIPETPTNTATPMETRLEGDRLVEAQGWYVNEIGQVVLTANPITTTPHQSGRVPIECRSLLPHGEP